MSSLSRWTFVEGHTQRERVSRLKGGNTVRGLSFTKRSKKRQKGLHVLILKRRKKKPKGKKEKADCSTPQPLPLRTSIHETTRTQPQRVTFSLFACWSSHLFKGRTCRCSVLNSLLLGEFFAAVLCPKQHCFEWFLLTIQCSFRPLLGGLFVTVLRTFELLFSLNFTAVLSPKQSHFGPFYSTISAVFLLAFRGQLPHFFCANFLLIQFC